MRIREDAKIPGLAGDFVRVTDWAFKRLISSRIGTPEWAAKTGISVLATGIRMEMTGIKMNVTGIRDEVIEIKDEVMGIRKRMDLQSAAPDPLPLFPDLCTGIVAIPF